MIQYGPFCLTIGTPFIAALSIPLPNGTNVRSARRSDIRHCFSLVIFTSAFPFLLRLALHRRRCRVLELEPVPRAAADIRRAQALRHDASAAEPAGVAVDDIAAVLEVLDGPEPWPAGA